MVHDLAGVWCCGEGAHLLHWRSRVWFSNPWFRYFKEQILNLPVTWGVKIVRVQGVSFTWTQTVFTSQWLSSGTGAVWLNANGFEAWSAHNMRVAARGWWSDDETVNQHRVLPVPKCGVFYLPQHRTLNISLKTPSGYTSHAIDRQLQFSHKISWTGI